MLMLKLKKAQERGLGLGKFIVSSIFEIISKAHQPCMRGYSDHFRLSHPIAGPLAGHVIQTPIAAQPILGFWLIAPPSLV